MKKRIAFFITLILLVLLCSTVYAETRMQYCAREASDHSYVAHTSEWQLVQTYRETCTQHSNCVINIFKLRHQHKVLSSRVEMHCVWLSND